MELIESKYNLAVKHFQQGENNRAIELFKQIIEVDNKHVLAQHYYGLLLILVSGTQSAAQHMNIALSLDPESKIIRDNHFGIALATYKKGNIRAALDLLEHAMGLLKEDFEIAANLARFYLLNDRIEKAWHLLVKLGDSRDFYCLYYQAVAAKLMGKEQGALKLFTEALRLKPLQQSASSNRTEKDNENDKAIKVLICYANESLPFQVHKVKDQIAFSIAGGHFNIEILLGNMDKNELFISNSEACDAEISKVGEYDLIINTISDAEIASEPLLILQRALQGKELSVINDPRDVLLTSRADVYQKLSGIKNVLMARTWQLAVKEDFEVSREKLKSIEVPFLLRPLGSSTGIGLEKIEDELKIDTLLPQLKGKIFNICPFIDFKSADDNYRKYRVFVIDGEIYPEHCVVSNHWNVHSSSRVSIMQDNEQYRHEEELFVNNISSVLNEKQLQAIYSIAGELKLDYFGIDFSIMHDNQIFVFEANSGMRVNPDYIKEFPYLKKPIERIIKAFRYLYNRKLTKVES